MLEKKRSRSLLLALVAVLGVGLFLTLRPRPRAPRPTAIATNARATTAAIPWHTSAVDHPHETPAVPPAFDGPPPDPPIIDDITIEKPEVCEGEDTLVSVKAHTPGNRDDAYLHYHVGADEGQVVPVRAYLDEDGNQPRIFVQAFGRQNAATAVEISSDQLRVKRCKQARYLIIHHRLAPNTFGEYEFRAQITKGSATDSFRPVVYHWDFGDGATLQTDKSYAIHSYEDRPQDRQYSQFVVKVEAVDATGGKLVSRAALQLDNPAFTNLAYSGVVTLLAQLDPRFPEIDRDGVVTQSARLWHNRPEPVTIERITERRYLHGQEVETVDVPVASLLPGSEIPPEGVQVTVALDTRSDPDLTQLDYHLMGHTREGIPVSGIFSVMRPPDRPTRQKSIPVTDALLEAKILKARELLGKEFVTDEDLNDLDREGAFEKLAARAQPNAESPGLQ